MEALIIFTFANSEKVRREIAQLGLPFSVSEKGKNITLVFDGVKESEAMFLLIKGVTGHGLGIAGVEVKQEEAEEKPTPKSSDLQRKAKADPDEVKKK